MASTRFPAYLLLINVLIQSRAMNMSDENPSCNRTLLQLQSQQQQKQMQEQMHIKESPPRAINVAVCSTGHLRSFTLPGVYSSLSTNLLQTAPGSVDVFLVGHLGNYKGNPDARSTIEIDGPATADDEHYIQALKHLELMGSDRVEHTDGYCRALEASWARDGIPHGSRYCTNVGHFMQIMWLDHCIHKVRNSGRQYDLLVRTRPDVGIFQPFPWDTISMDKVTYMQKDKDGRADHFFTMPWKLVSIWWDHVAQSYANGFMIHPDYAMFTYIFDDNDSEGIDHSVEGSFPVAIVRGNRSAQCFRIVTSPELRQDCEQKTATGFWEQLHL